MDILKFVKSSDFGMIIVGAFMLFGLVVIIIGGRDTGKWKPNSKPNLNAKIIDIDSKCEKLSATHASITTTITFDDGFYYTTLRSKEETHGLTRTIYLDAEARQHLVERAIKLHEKAVKKKLK